MISKDQLQQFLGNEVEVIEVSKENIIIFKHGPGNIHQLSIGCDLSYGLFADKDNPSVELKINLA